MKKLLLALFISIFSTTFAEDSIFDIMDEDPDSAQVEEAEDDSVFSHLIEKNGKASEPGYHDSAKIIALNKITANSKVMTIRLGQKAYFHNAEITLKRCWQSPDPYLPGNRILINVNENKPDEDGKNIFHGWIISSQAALSSLEHPVYEFFAVECMGKRVQ